MPVDGVERRLAAILSADVVGYSRLMSEDEDGTVRRLAAYREEITLLVEQHGGRYPGSRNVKRECRCTSTDLEGRLMSLASDSPSPGVCKLTKL